VTEFIAALLTDGCAVQMSRPQMVNIPERYAPLPSEDDDRNLSAEERQRKREMSERYRRMVAAQRCVSVCVSYLALSSRHSIITVTKSDHLTQVQFLLTSMV